MTASNSPSLAVRERRLRARLNVCLRRVVAPPRRGGRLVVQGLPSGHCQVSCEVAGDPADPLTAARRAVLEPLTTVLVHR